jgi:intraflagellar transport protein 122
MYLAAGEVIKAISIYGDKGKAEELIELTRTLEKYVIPLSLLLICSRTQLEGLKKAAGYFRKLNCLDYTIETFLKIGDFESLLELYIEAQKWDEAARIIETNPKLDSAKFYLPYANWLAVHDLFEEAQEAFRKAGQPQASSKVLEQLTMNAVIERRYEDAAYYFWMLSKEYLKLTKNQAIGE